MTATMQFIPTRFQDAWLVEPERRNDDRGFFARTWCQREFEQRGLNPSLVQCSVSFNHRAGTLRGMHYQTDPYQEAKLVRCTQGRIYDVIVDLRERSKTFGKWQGFELSAQNRRSLYIPEGFAHGFQTIDPDTEVLYQMSEFFFDESARGFHHADPAIGIEWPLEVNSISDSDQNRPRFSIEDAICGTSKFLKRTAPCCSQRGEMINEN